MSMSDQIVAGMNVAWKTPEGRIGLATFGSYLAMMITSVAIGAIAIRGGLGLSGLVAGGLTIGIPLVAYSLIAAAITSTNLDAKTKKLALGIVATIAVMGSLLDIIIGGLGMGGVLSARQVGLGLLIPASIGLGSFVLPFLCCAPCLSSAACASR